jgi:hypothetical protein
MELLVLLVVGLSLILIYTPVTGGIASDMIALCSYLLRFTGGLDTIPYVLQRVASLSDVSRRIAEHAEKPG